MEQLEAREYFVDLDHPIAGTLKYPGPPISPHTEIATWVYQRAPLLGEHTKAIICKRLGFSEEEFQSLRSDGVV